MPNTEVCLESSWVLGNREMWFLTNFEEANSCKTILDKKKKKVWPGEDKSGRFPTIFFNFSCHLCALR